MEFSKSLAFLSASRLPAGLVGSGQRGGRSRPFYGWWIVAVCLIANLLGNTLGLFGAGVYLHVLIGTQTWPTSLVSGAITVFYVTSALLLIPVGTMIGRYGPRFVFLGGAGHGLRCRGNRSRQSSVAGLRRLSRRRNRLGLFVDNRRGNGTRAMV